ncbi:uncharacterized protein LOC125264325 [Megalobrama amblycephala]|uniref:uncharacterized protein LOC125264325 n=1 Tax=Megalobrama amblycephala TaxID=75352 RepID=UPI002013E73F|nr:uncharacterized protein LOC125264325 [Megalobrama amblycephala]XP_048039522.1 uncharacterized protein LOC125264325 [Megalobrama amblycephala]XP_048039523.1 uncharacterized protein LOC125264325 [Megalobrama amblycephala]XP_048039525.1 uncharacterized protein LOC125264325 [Megalobrama amblycephala]XP_048039526.1 uncharacterized protein LOC125264325 [Megalobrama amblycephala]XP_048039527.1 uncharacterized protein LOC125264325 [Megalobrama amblycephala]XP_048039528.1 uncharacterized protein LO
MSEGKGFRKCADPCPRFLTPEDPHTLCVLCLGEEHARSAFEDTGCELCERFPMRTLRSRLTLFSRGETSTPVPGRSGPARAEAERRLHSWGSQVELAAKFERGVTVSQPQAAAGGDELLDDDDAISLTSSDPGASALLAESPREQEMVLEKGEVTEVASFSSKPPCPAYVELLEVVEHAAGRLQLPWQRVRKEPVRGRLDERFLSDHNPIIPVSLPFLPDLHVEVGKAWKNPYSARIHLHQRGNFADVEEWGQHGYVSMPPIDETFANYLVTGSAPTLKAPFLPSKPLKMTSRLNGRAYAAAGQAGAALHTMAVLQAYQADLLKDLDQGQGLSPDAVAELRQTTDLALRATKQTAASIGRSMAAMVATERHLWLTMADIGEKEKGSLLDAPVSPSELFGGSVEAVVGKFREARARSAAFKKCIPLRSDSGPRQPGGSGPPRAEAQRQGQRSSVAARAPPPPRSKSQKRRDAKKRRGDLREVINQRRDQRH